MKGEKKGKEGEKRNRRPRARQVLGSLEDGSFSFCYWGRIGCQCCSGRIAEKDGDDGKDEAARSSSEKEQMAGGDSTKVEALKKGPDRTAMRKEEKSLRGASC